MWVRCWNLWYCNTETFFAKQSAPSRSIAKCLAVCGWLYVYYCRYCCEHQVCIKFSKVEPTRMLFICHACCYHESTADIITLLCIECRRRVRHTLLHSLPNTRITGRVQVPKHGTVCVKWSTGSEPTCRHRTLSSWCEWSLFTESFTTTKVQPVRQPKGSRDRKWWRWLSFTLGTK